LEEGESDPLSQFETIDKDDIGTISGDLAR
jgi:hypothetical protein